MDLLILGAGGHGKVVKEVAEATDRYNRIDFIDDSYDGSNPHVIGKLSDYKRFTSRFTHAFVAIGNSAIRNQWQVRLTTFRFSIPVLIHPDAYISPSAVIDEGTVVMPKAVVQSNVKIGIGCIISAGAIIDHDAVVGDYCHVNVRAVVAAASRVPNGMKIDYGDIWRGSTQAPVADKRLDNIQKSDFGTGVSYY